MGESYLMLNVNDPKSRDVAEILSNSTAKKILGLLAEEELSESQLGERLKIPLNTIGYNIKKLKNSGLIEPARKFFWSVKGKKIIFYKVSNKKIVISPKESFKGLLPSLIVSAFLAFAIPYIVLYFNNRNSYYSETSSLMAESAQKAADMTLSSDNVNGFISIFDIQSQTIWFFFGAVVALCFFVGWNWKKIW